MKFSDNLTSYHKIHTVCMSWGLCLPSFLNKGDHPYQPLGTLRGADFPVTTEVQHSIQTLLQVSSPWPWTYIFKTYIFKTFGSSLGTRTRLKLSGPHGHWTPNLRLISPNLRPSELTRHRLMMCVCVGSAASITFPEAKLTSLKVTGRIIRTELITGGTRTLLMDGWSASFLQAAHSSPPSPKRTWRF